MQESLSRIPPVLPYTEHSLSSPSAHLISKMI